MDSIVLSLREISEGWRVFQGEDPLFWFPDCREAIATAQMFAEVNVKLCETTAFFEVHRLGDTPALTLSPAGP